MRDFVIELKVKFVQKELEMGSFYVQPWFPVDVGSSQ